MDPARATEVLSQRERRMGCGRARRQESTPVVALLMHSALEVVRGAGELQVQGAEED